MREVPPAGLAVREMEGPPAATLEEGRKAFIAGFFKLAKGTSVVMMVGLKNQVEDEADSEDNFLLYSQAWIQQY